MTTATIHDKLWLWCHQAGSHDGMFGLPRNSAVTPAAAAAAMGIDNLIMVCYGGEPRPPFAPHAAPLRAAHRLVWSVVGDSSSTRNDHTTDLDAVLELAAHQPNVTGAIMDDFFLNEPRDGKLARWDVNAVAEFRHRLHTAPRPLDLWVVVYDLILHLPIRPWLEHCDTITYWTWRAADLPQLEENYARLEALTPGKRRLLGCYLWDYGQDRPMPLDAVRYQCEFGTRLLGSGRADGLIFLASNLCDLKLDTVAWVTQWAHSQE